MSLGVLLKVIASGTYVVAVTSLVDLAIAEENLAETDVGALLEFILTGILDVLFPNPFVELARPLAARVPTWLFRVFRFLRLSNIACARFAGRAFSSCRSSVFLRRR